MRKRRRRHPPFPLFYQTNTKNFLIITQDEEDDDGDFKVHKKSDKQIVGGKVLDTFEDETLSCRDCAEDFVFTSGEQEFYASKGWENKPTRCEACKIAKKARFGEDKPKCYAYERGECTRGDSCKFSHEEGGGGGSRPPSRGGWGGGGGVCFAFLKGECTRGDSCRFSHDKNAAPPKASGSCYAFQEGRCDRGDACRFQHN